MSGGFDKRGYWENKVLRWEAARYGRLSWLWPASWTLRRRMHAAERVVRERCPPGVSVLELGCGSGLLSERLRDYYGTYVGIDFAAVAVEKAKERIQDPRVEFRHASVLDASMPPADLTILLGLVDWLEAGEAAALFRRLRTRHVLFSFTEAGAEGGHFAPYRLYRALYDSLYGRNLYCARSYCREDIEGWLRSAGTFRLRIFEPSLMDPGRLAYVELLDQPEGHAR